MNLDPENIVVTSFETVDALIAAQPEHTGPTYCTAC